MKFKKVGQKYLIKLERGEEVIKTLTQLCQSHQINFGTVSGIGGFHQVILGWYELSSKSYHWKDFLGNLEVTSLNGNISILDGQPFLHIHCTISDESFHGFGGHLKEGRVGVTLEVVIEKSEGEMTRKMDEEIGLNLLNFEN